ETLTDQNPAGGWVNNTGSSFTGQENGDECAWISSGQGAAALVAFSTGSFAMQSTWSNDTNRCDISHPIVSGSGSGGTPTANFTYSASALTVSFTDTSTDSGGTIGSHAWTFGDGRTSSATNPTHTYAASGTYSVYDTVNNRSSTKTVSITVTASTSSQLIVNGGFETGSTAPWALTAGVLCSNSGCPGETAHRGSWFAWLDGYGLTHTDTATQSVS